MEITVEKDVDLLFLTSYRGLGLISSHTQSLYVLVNPLAFGDGLIKIWKFGWFRFGQFIRAIIDVDELRAS